jgi:branched-chain amino acid transport system ATP-binding protein
VLLVEHDMSLVMEISDEIVVLSFGQKIAEDVPAAIQDNPEVIKVYLGE